MTGTAPACQPGNIMRMNVSSGTEVVLLQPAPALPSIQVNFCFLLGRLRTCKRELRPCSWTSYQTLHVLS